MPACAQELHSPSSSIVRVGHPLAPSLAHRGACAQHTCTRAGARTHALLLLRTPPLHAAVEEANAFALKKGKSGVRTWAANPDLFPCELSSGALEKARAVIKVGGEWRAGHSSLMTREVLCTSACVCMCVRGCTCALACVRAHACLHPCVHVCRCPCLRMQEHALHRPWPATRPLPIHATPVAPAPCRTPSRPGACAS